MKIINADQAGALIQDNATIFLGGLAMAGLAEEVLQGIERRFLNTGHPQMVSTWACGAIGNAGEAGMKHFAHKGLIKRVVAGHFGQTGKEMMRMVAEVLGRSPGFMLAITGHSRPTELERQEHQQDDSQPFAHRGNSVAATGFNPPFLAAWVCFRVLCA